MRLKYDPASEPLHISVMKYFSNRQVLEGDVASPEAEPPLGAPDRSMSLTSMSLKYEPSSESL